MTKMVTSSALILPHSHSRDHNKQSEYLIYILGATQEEKYFKMLWSSYFCAVHAKKHKCLGRDLKNLFLSNKKHYSVVSDSISNFF